MMARPTFSRFLKQAEGEQGHAELAKQANHYRAKSQARKAEVSMNWDYESMLWFTCVCVCVVGQDDSSICQSKAGVTECEEGS